MSTDPHLRHDSAHAPLAHTHINRVARLVQQGRQLHGQRQFTEAATQYEQAVREDPDCAEAWHLLGFAQLQAGHLHEAIGSLKQATDLGEVDSEVRVHYAVALLAAHDFPTAEEQINLAKAANHNDPGPLVDLGYQFFQTNQFDAAKECFELAILLNDRTAFAYNCLALIAKHQRDFNLALQHLEMALHIAPEYAEAHNNIGNLYRDRCDWDRAEHHFKAALRFDSNCQAAHVNLALVAVGREQFRQAIELCHACLQRDPTSVPALTTLGNVYHETGNFNGAIECYELALELRPECAAILSNLSAALRQVGNIERAIECAQSAVDAEETSTALHHLGLAQTDAGLFREALATLSRASTIAPQDPDILLALGNCLSHLDEIGRSVECFRQTVDRDPENLAAHNNLGNMLLKAGDLLGATKAYQRVAELDPNPRWKLRQLRVFPTVFNSSQHCLDARDRFLDACHNFCQTPVELLPEEVSSSGCEPPFQLQFLPGSLKSLKRGYAQLFKQSFSYQHDDKRAAKPRIGIVVTRGHERVFLRSYPGLLKRLDTARFDLVIACSATGRQIIDAATDRRNCQRLTLSDDFAMAARQILEANFDVLLYREIGTDSLNYFLPFCRLAPIQCTSFGIQVTSGIRSVDYYLSSQLVESNYAPSHYTERLVLAETLLPYRFRSKLDPNGPKTRGNFGLEQSDHVYLCAQHLGKFHPDFDPWLGNLLHRDPLGKVVIAADRHAAHVERLRRRLQSTLPDVFDRILFLPHQTPSDYLQLIANADVLLDPPHFGGVNTTYDAFSLGKPVVTLPTEFHRGRFTQGCYKRMGIDDCVAVSPGEYVDQALEIGCNKAYREALGADIANASEVLFEDHATIVEHQRIFEDWIDEARSS